MILGNFFGLKDENETGKKLGDSNDSRTKYYIEFEEPTSTTRSSSSEVPSVDRQRRTSTSTSSSVVKNKIKSDWVPLAVKPLQNEQNRREKSFDADGLFIEIVFVLDVLCVLV